MTLHKWSFMESEMDYKNFGKAVADFYLQTGYNGKSKSDIDSEMFNFMCEHDIIDDTLSPIELGLRLKTSAANINKYREYRFYQGKLTDKNQNYNLLKVLSNNLESISREKWLVFSIHNITTKLYLEKILQSKNRSYDYSFNASNIKMNIETFVEIYTLVGGDIKIVVDNLLKNKQFEKDYPEEAKAIIQMQPANKLDVVKLLGILTGLAKGAEIIKTLFGMGE